MKDKPSLRFKEFNDKWEEKKLGEVCEIIMGQSPSSENYNMEKNGIPLIQGNADCKKRKIFPRMYTIEITKRSIPNDIIMTVRAPVGAISFSNIESCIGRGVCAIRNGNLFIYHYLIKIEDNWDKVSQGTTFTSVNSSDIRGIKLPYPSLEEQEKIGDFLSTVDSKIEKSEKKLELLKEYKKGVMEKIFTQKIRFKDSNGENYPEWEEKKLGEVCECLDNQRKPLNSSYRSKIKGNIPYYGANGIQDYINNYLFDEELVLLAEDGGNFEEYKDKAIAQYVIGKSWVNNHAHILRGTKNLINKYLFYTIVHKDIRSYINGTSRSKLNKSDMLEIKIKIPLLEEQEKIANYLSAIDEKLEREEKKIEDLKEFKKGLLQKMFV